MHGTSMVFLFNTPGLAGFGNNRLPRQSGSRDIACPRLNAISYWIFLLSGVFLYSSFLVGHLPDGGWFAYTPLTSKAFSPGINLDFWGLGVVFVGISTTVGAVNFIVTTFKMRAPGMTLNRLPIFVWSMLVFSFMVIFSVPAVTVAAGLLELDRLFGTAFYSVGGGGSVLLYQHLFWFWGHPEVYILFLPATGMVSTIIPVAAREKLAGYLWVAAAFIAIAFISFGVWVHHMFATGGPALALAVFSAASLVIAIPSGILYFCWIATMWTGRVKFHTPMLFCIGFLVIFLLGGITGVMVAVMPIDWQVTDSYFVVAHFHYVLNGAVVFPIFGALYYWLPKMTGRMLSERLGKWSFWTMLVGFNVSFFPMHILGLMGMQRRIYTYSDGLGWGTLNLVVSIGGVLFGAGTGITLFNFFWSRWRGEPAPDNPWGADTLEWATPSPPPDYNFAAVPVVHSRHPLWDDEELVHAAGPSGFDREGAERRETPVVVGLVGRPEHAVPIPRPTYLPFRCALGVFVFFSGMLVDATLVLAAGVAGVLVAAVMWTWRTEPAT
jgi:cytochrome c oxidase subunit I+III